MNSRRTGSSFGHGLLPMTCVGTKARGREVTCEQSSNRLLVRSWSPAHDLSWENARGQEATCEQYPVAGSISYQARLVYAVNPSSMGFSSFT